eukprot:TRINITY_DN10065_c0_g1_i1.p1 TRINITY_DN10065_c0_g1~~TRINITY_DN10065_c0_g1_i1.p1  ORF type:complete len:197 (+),score=32.22 TRINITY_DN10065_c0_g1_i1:35-625(+)
MSAESNDRALQEVAQVLVALQRHDSFQNALQDPAVVKAVKHWTGEQRLPPEECEDWRSNPAIMMVLSEFRRLEHHCRAAGLKVPLATVLSGSDELSLADGRKLSAGKLLAPRPEPTAVDDGQQLEDLPPIDPRAWRLVISRPGKTNLRRSQSSALGMGIAVRRHVAQQGPHAGSAGPERKRHVLDRDVYSMLQRAN